MRGAGKKIFVDVLRGTAKKIFATRNKADYAFGGLRNRIDFNFEYWLAMPFALIVAALRLILHHLDFLI